LGEKLHKTYIRVALRKIEQEMDLFAKPPAVHATSSILTPLGAFANELGSSLLPSAPGPAATFKPLEPPLTQKFGDISPTPASSVNQMPRIAPQRVVEYSGLSMNEEIEPDIVLRPLVSQPVHVQLQPSTGPLPKNAFASLSPTSDYAKLLPLPNPLLQSSSGSNLIGNSQRSGRIKGRPSVRPLSEGEFVEVNGVSALKIEFLVKPAANSAGTQVYASVRAILEGSQPETEPPIGGSLAHVLKWIAPDGTQYQGLSNIYVPAEVDGSWCVIVSLPDDIMVGIDLSGEAKPNI
jgi:hypothetical protein